jgi:hypothetical protein
MVRIDDAWRQQMESPAFQAIECVEKWIDTQRWNIGEKMIDQMETFQEGMFIQIDIHIGIGGLSKIELGIVVGKRTFRFKMIGTPRCGGIVRLSRCLVVHVQLQPDFRENT